FERNLDVGLGRKVQAGRECPQSLAAQADLLKRFLAADVEHWTRFAAQTVERGEEQRALADSRIACEEDHHARHEPAAEGAIELADSRPIAPAGSERHLIDGQDGRERAQGGAARAQPFLDRAERSAPAALSEPLCRLESAVA